MDRRIAAALALAVALTVALAMSPRPPQARAPLIFWVVPWGTITASQPSPGTLVGVVVVVPCSSNASVDFAQFELSISLIQQYRNRTPLFVNLFCAAPTWRGTLTSVDLSHASAFLNALKFALGNGSGAYIGFSEMTACVAHAACRAQLADAYRLLEAMFPDADFFYYGTASEKPGDIIELARAAGLRLIGEDLYEYKYENGTLEVPKSFLENLEALKSSGIPVMVGEIGFRACDAHGYIQPWNWEMPVKVKNCAATVEFYRQAITQLLAVRPAYIGVWAWNDPTFGVSASKEIVEFFASYAAGGG